MQFPIQTEKLTFIVTGEVSPVLVYGTNQQKNDAQGRPLFKIPVVISGTGAKYDPNTNITVPGPIPNLQRGVVKVRGLIITTWTIRGNDGRERSGVSLRADGVEQVKA